MNEVQPAAATSRNENSHSRTKPREEDRAVFQRWTKEFGFKNPRQLVRLVNTYRLLLEMNALPGRSDDFLVALLFWMEYLSGLPEKERTLRESFVRDTAQQTAPNDTGVNLVAIREALRGTPEKPVDLAAYDRDKAYIELFTLPFRDEPAPAETASTTGGPVK